MTDKELDDLFKKSFASHEMPVPPDMWSRIQGKEKKRRGAFIWWWTLGVAAALILVSTAVWFYYPSSAVQTNSAHSNVAAKSSATQKNSVATTPDNTNSEEKKLPDNQVTNNHVIDSNNNLSSSTTQSDLFGQKKAEATDIPGKTKSSIKENQSDPLHNHLQSSEKNQSHTIENNTSQVTTEKSVPSSQNVDTIFMADNTLPETKSTDKQSIQVTDSNRLQNDSVAVAKTTEKKASTIQVKKADTKRALRVELMIAGYTANRDLYDVKNDQERFSLAAADPKASETLHSYSINARIEKPLGRHLSIKTGLQFLQTHQSVSYTHESVNEFAIVNTVGFSTDTARFARLNINRNKVEGVYNSINIPLLLAYQTEGKKMNFGISAGVVANIFSWYKGEVPTADYKAFTDAKNTFKKNNGISLYTSVSVARNFGNWQLFAEPHLQYGLSSLTKQSVFFKQRITNYGVGIGVRMNINKPKKNK